jgi:hypothetical protein
LGYQFLGRLSLAAAASLGQCAVALAGAIEGSIAFPGQLVQSMTLYAADLDTSRVHSVQLPRGQANFSVEVPAGRYLVFMAPNDAGAPDIFGAYTQYSLCSPHDVDGQCEDHTPIQVMISAKAPHAAVTIDDWYLTDDVAERMEHLRAAAAGRGSGSYADPMSAPRFSEYPSAEFDHPSPPQIDFGATGLTEEDRGSVQRALSGGPNFAGQVTAAMTRCGPECGRVVLVDWGSGQVQEPAQLGEIQGWLPCRADEAVLFRRDSRLMSISRSRGGVVVTQYYVWNQKTAALTPAGEYRRTTRTFCAVAARPARSCDD